MDIFEIDKFILFLLFFIPGFVSLKIYDLIIPGEQRDFSKSFLEAIGFSALNYAALSWLIAWLYFGNVYQLHRFWFLASVFCVVFIFPIFWPVVLTRIWTWKTMAKYVIPPLKKPWDYVFGKGKHYWVIVHLKDGRKIGGRFDVESFASSFPAEEQIYLEEVWELDDAGKFKVPIDRSAGILFLSSEILAVELFR